MNLQLRPVKNDDIAFRDIEEEVYAVAPHSGKFYAFNKVGSYIWELTDNQNTIDQIIIKVTEKYDVAPEVAENEVLNFISKMADKGLISLEQ